MAQLIHDRGRINRSNDIHGPLYTPLRYVIVSRGRPLTERRPLRALRFRIQVEKR